MFQSKKQIHLLSDFLVFNLALVIASYWFYNGSSFLSIQEFKVATLLVNLLWITTLFFSNRRYKPFEYTGFIKEVRNLFPNYIIFIALSSALFIFFLKKEGDGTLFSWYYALSLLAIYIGRIVVKSIVSKILKYTAVNYITIGDCDTLPKIEKTLSEVHFGKINYLGSFGKPSRHKYLGSAEDINDFLQKNDVNLILYVSNALPPSVLRQLMHYAKHNFIEFKIIPLEMDILTEGTKLELQEGIFFSAKDEYSSPFKDGILKRLFDILFSVFVIVFILSWLFPLLCLIIMLESNGSPIFIQDRVGFRGKVFRCIKFRSMSVKENGQDVRQVIFNDTRVTKVGSFMRKTNLDEMPQFFNVLMGDMSVVGPRPHAVSHDIEFKNTTEEYSLRHYSKPGITGWAQVNGWRGPTDTDNKIIKRTQCDLWYVKNWSLGLDLKIIFLTVFSSKVRHNAF